MSESATAFAGEKKLSEPIIFKYFDGKLERRGDVASLFRRLYYNGKVPLTKVEFWESVAQRSEPATSQAIASIAEIFGLHRYDDVSGDGLTDDQVIELFDEFNNVLCDEKLARWWVDLATEVSSRLPGDLANVDPDRFWLGVILNSDRIRRRRAFCLVEFIANQLGLQLPFAFFDAIEGNEEGAKLAHAVQPKPSPVDSSR